MKQDEVSQSNALKRLRTMHRTLESPASLGWGWRVLLFTLLSIVISACGGYGGMSAKTAADTSESYAPEAPMEAEMEAGGLANDAYQGEAAPRDGNSAPLPSLDAKSLEEGTDEADASGDSVAPPSEREGETTKRRPILIYTASLGIAVFHVDENLDKIEKMALDVGGYLVTRGNEAIQVRVPAEQFEVSVEAILKLGDVHRREIRAQDVTAEYHDLQIRIQNALAVRKRLEALLDRAQDVKEAIKVEEELRRLTVELELMKGRIKLLRELSSYSTITVEFTERTNELQARVHLPFPWLEQLGLHRLLDL